MENVFASAYFGFCSVPSTLLVAYIKEKMIVFARLGINIVLTFVTKKGSLKGSEGRCFSDLSQNALCRPSSLSFDTSKGSGAELQAHFISGKDSLVSVEDKAVAGRRNLLHDN